MVFQPTSIIGHSNQPDSNDEIDLNIRPQLPPHSYSKEKLERLVPQSLALAEKCQARPNAQFERRLQEKAQMNRPQLAAGQINLSDVDSLKSLMHAKAIPILNITFDDDRSSDSDEQNSESLTGGDEEETLQEGLARIVKSKTVEDESTRRRKLASHSGSDLRKLIHSKIAKATGTMGSANATFKRSATVGNNLNKTKTKLTIPADSPFSIPIKEKPLNTTYASPGEEGAEAALGKDYKRSGSITYLITKTKARMGPKRGRRRQPISQDQSAPAGKNDTVIGSAAQVAPTRSLSQATRKPPSPPEASIFSEDKAEIWRQMQAMAQNQLRDNDSLMKRGRSQVAGTATTTPLAMKARPTLLPEARRETANATFAKRSTTAGTNPLLDKVRAKSPPSSAVSFNPLLPLNKSPLSAIPTDSPLFIPPNDLSRKQAPPTSKVSSNSTMKRAATVGGGLSRSTKLPPLATIPAGSPLQSSAGNTGATLPKTNPEASFKRNTSFGNMIRNISFGSSNSNMKRNTSFGNGMKRNTSFGNVLSQTKAMLLQKTGSRQTKASSNATFEARTSPSEPSETASAGDCDNHDGEFASEMRKKKSLSTRIKASLHFGNKPAKEFNQKFDPASFFGTGLTDQTDVSETSRSPLDQSDTIDVNKLQDSQDKMESLDQTILLAQIEEEILSDNEGAPLEESDPVEEAQDEDLSEDSDINDEDLSEDSDIESDDGVIGSAEKPKSCLKVKKQQDSLHTCRGLDSPSLTPACRETPSKILVSARSKLTAGTHMDSNLSNYLNKLRRDEMANESSRTASMTDSEPTIGREEKLRWGSVQIRVYSQCLGDNPACSEGAPIQFDWDYELAGILNVDKFEVGRTTVGRDGDRSLRIPASYRQFMLLSMGYTLEQVAMAVSLKNKAQKRRVKTLSRLRFMSLDEQVEKIKTVKLFPDKARSAGSVQKAMVS